MANTPPPYENITGISRTVMKDNAQTSVIAYNGNARPGELVVDLTNDDIYVGNVNGGLTLISTGSGVGNSVPGGPVGAIQVNAGGNLFTGSANLVVSGNDINIAGNIIPLVDNVYDLGSADYRWKSVHVGPGSLYISNTISNVSAVLTVDGSTLKINGVPQLAVGQLSFVENTIESTTGSIDIEIGQIDATANLVLNRNTVLAAGKTFGLVDTVTGNVAKLSVTDGVLEIDGANQLQVGQLKFINNTIESTTGNINIEIGNTNDTANLVINRNMIIANGKSINVDNLTVNGTINYTPTYGQFWSNVTQTVSSPNTEYQFTFNNTDGHNNVELGTGVSNSRVIINKTGLYNIQFSAQIDKASGGGTSSSAYIWFKKNGTAIGDSAGFFTLDNAIQTVETWNILANVTTAGDYYEIAYAASATNFSFPTLVGNVAIGYPASPSIIITVTPIGP